MTDEEKRQVPNLLLNEKQEVVTQKKEIPLIINGKDTMIVIRKLSTGQRNKIRNECTTTKIVNGMPSITVNDTEFQEKILSEVIVTAPFDKTLQGIKNLPAEVSDYLFEQYNEFAEPSDKKKD